MNWDDIRIFLAAHRAGTLRGAAEQLDIDQTTVGRRLGALERTLGSRLFLRTTAGLGLTDSGRQVLDTAEGMERLAVSFERRSEGADARVAGEVRVTTTDALAVDFVVPAIERLQQHHPDVRVLLSTTTRIVDLARREADIAVRTTRPDQPDLIVRLLARWDVGLYATRRYLDRFGEPRPGSRFAGHDIARYQPGVMQQQHDTLAGESAADGRVVAELDSSLMLATFVRAGLALGELPAYLAQRDPELVRIWPGRHRTKPYETWLVLHQDLAHTARVRVVVDALVETFAH
ncbi:MULTISPECIES: LysR family transcriptional regulator [unclassified Burkholderia]|uniref:LysR family transcriptional regulator n=1 Tax=unclassified Burkholderia TaxID=2613784 RepID=UPI000F5743D0|nr:MULTISPECIES: LysR family transcriptional regulator [unclassified Burkholderia]RQR35134.1 LysR family transcriptional regulator [Burkholderia sp. Bp9131]RQR69031.1 LysR family transcriptional regulator [Burkholderia sp. Bp9015]RQS04300.1 LysR family transcriptional regulator [Burkholderia sp. Bp8991]RQS29814.1 LysR family transcriptional regulator [Burkholderia sp. Bp8995]RQS47910.1 LysR family transcriptional regulator [Burkholderia sp. Bp8989]